MNHLGYKELYCLCKNQEIVQELYYVEDGLLKPARIKKDFKLHASLVDGIDIIVSSGVA